MELSKSKIGWGRVALFFIVLHFCLIFVYALPDSFSYQPLKTYVKPYVEPVFTQQWSMFAPCPVIDAHVEVRYWFENGDSIGWISPTENARLMHSWLKGSHHGELVLAESNLMYWLSLDLDYLNYKVNSDFPGDQLENFYKGYSYFKIKDYLFGNAMYLFEKAPKSGQLRCYLKDVVTGTEDRITLPKYVY